jgi:hypothetical protein
MAGQAPEGVWSLIAAEPAQDADSPQLRGWMQRFCRAASRELAASGVGVSLVSAEGQATVLAASSPAGEIVEQCQFTLGEGPCVDAYNLGRPILTPDLSEAARSQWPGYAPAVQEHGVRAVFAFPLQLGGARLGAMDVYRDETGALESEAVSQALAFAEAAMSVLLDTEERSAFGDGSALDVALEGRFDLYQAQGMIQAQLGVTLTEAMVRLRGHAYAENRPLDEVAADVINRRLVFEPDV